MSEASIQLAKTKLASLIGNGIEYEDDCKDLAGDFACAAIKLIEGLIERRDDLQQAGRDLGKACDKKNEGIQKLKAKLEDSETRRKIVEQ